MANISRQLPWMSTIPQAKMTMTMVRIATARFESTPLIPILPKIATSEAKKAERIAYIAQDILSLYVNLGQEAHMRIAKIIQVPGLEKKRQPVPELPMCDGEAPESFPLPATPPERSPAEKEKPNEAPASNSWPADAQWRSD